MSDRTETTRLPTLLLALTMIVAGALLLWETRGTYLIIDQWSFFAHYLDWDAGTLLEPANGHLTLFPVLLHKINFELFGTAFLPFRIESALAQIGVALLLYLNVRPRLGPWIALAVAAIVAMFGTAWDVTVATIGLVNQLALLGGLAAMLFLERRDPLGDALTCVALVFAVSSFSLALPFVIAVAVEIFLGDRTKALRRAWIPGIPAAVYLVWRVWAAKFDNSPEITLANVLSLPETMLDGIASASAGLTGLTRLSGQDGVLFTVPIDYGRVIAFALVAATAYTVWRRPARSPRFWAALAALTGYLILTGVALGPGRSIVDVRYSLPAAVFLVLFLAEVGADYVHGTIASRRIGRAFAFALPIVLAVALAGNLANLHYGAVHLRERADTNLAQLTALELIRDELERVPGSADRGFPTRTLDVTQTLGEYTRATTRYGSPAYPPAELLAAPAVARLAADETLVAGLGLTDLQPLRRLPFRPDGDPPVVEAATGGFARPTGQSCVRLVRDPTVRGLPETSAASIDETLDALRDLASTTRIESDRQLAEVQKALDQARRVAQFILVLPVGGAAFELSPGPGADLGLRRYGDGYAAAGAFLAGGTATVLRIPRDGQSQPWRALVETAEDITACGI